MISPLTSHLVGHRLADFVDGNLPPDDATRWREHLLRCAACSDVVSAERTLRVRMRLACTPAPPTRLMSTLRVVAVDDGTGSRVGPAAAGAGEGRAAAFPPAWATLHRREVVLTRAAAPVAAMVVIVVIGVVAGSLGVAPWSAVPAGQAVSAAGSVTGQFTRPVTGPTSGQVSQAAAQPYSPVVPVAFLVRPQVTGVTGASAVPASATGAASAWTTAAVEPGGRDGWHWLGDEAPVPVAARRPAPALGTVVPAGG